MELVGDSGILLLCFGRYEIFRDDLLLLLLLAGDLPVLLLLIMDDAADAADSGALEDDDADVRWDAVGIGDTTLLVLCDFDRSLGGSSCCSACCCLAKDDTDGLFMEAISDDRRILPPGDASTDELDDERELIDPINLRDDPPDMAFDSNLSEALRFVLTGFLRIGLIFFSANDGS